MRIVAITTSTRLQGLCLRVPEQVDRVALDRYVIGQPRTLNERLWQLLDEANLGIESLDLIACDVGPGSFTGLRLGLSTARALSWATGTATVGVGSLEVLIEQARRGRHNDAVYAGVLPSRREVIYVGVSSPAGVAEAEVQLEELVPWLRSVETSFDGLPLCIVGPEPTAKAVYERLQSDLATSSGEVPSAMEWQHIEAPCPEILADLAGQIAARNEAQPALRLVPRYLAASEAERKAGSVIDQKPIAALAETS